MNAPPECRARDSSIILSKIVRARTKVSFIETKSAERRKGSKLEDEMASGGRDSYLVSGCTCL